MSDETNYENQAPGATGASAATAERVGFCQDCGTPLTRDTAHAVGAGVFCEPCLATRVGTTSPQGYTTVPPVDAVPPAGSIPVGSAASAQPLPGEPHPVLAGLLGLIPGVGAMYNGQYAKGLAHLVVFVVLTSLSDHADGIFGLLVVGWVFYQVFDAYHTAKARLEGRPLPNPFGLNDIGERLGMGRHSGAAGFAGAAPAAGATPPPGSPTWTGDPVHTGAAAYGSSPDTQPYTAPAYTAPGYAPTSYAPTSYVPPSYVPTTTGPDWVGYVPPDHFASSTGGVTNTPYSQTYAGDTQPYTGAAIPTGKHFPMGAFWLIGLGVVFLLFEFGQQWGWSLNFNWVLALLFAGLAAMTLMRRLHTGVPLAAVLRAPVVLAVLAVLFLLQALNIASLGRTWPVLLIAFGALLILERSERANAAYIAPGYPASGSVVPSMQDAEAERTRAAWAAANPTESDVTKGGQ